MRESRKEKGSSTIELSDYNMLYLPSAESYRFPWINPPEGPGGKTFDKWWELGFDRRSIIANSRFANPEFDLPETDAHRL